MKRWMLSFLLTVVVSKTFAVAKDSTVKFDLPDSITATAFISSVAVPAFKIKKEMQAGIRTSEVSLSLEAEKKERSVEFEFPSAATVIAIGINVKKEKNELEWEYEWKPNTTYKLLIATAADSAENFILYSGYVFLPEENKWKLIGTCRINGQWSSIKTPETFFSAGIKSSFTPTLSDTWIQRLNGSWKNLDRATGAMPVINPMPNIDSIAQYDLDKAVIEQNLSLGWLTKEGVYYKIEEPGNGKSFNASDTITVLYSLRIFGTEQVISGGTEKPDTFPLNRLIKAWQIAVPMVKTGGRIRLVIPSGLGYSIRTRAPKIPPNSILDFEVRVLDAKSAVK